MSILIRRALPLLVLLGCSLGARAQETRPFVIGTVHTLHSAVLGEDRILNVRVPDGYSPDSAALYPVVYVLDGSAGEDFVHIAGIVEFMSTYDLMPRSIVVGIANVDRGRDFTHPTTDDTSKAWIPINGGSERFMAFLEREMQPFVDANYRTNGRRTLIGQSLGGLLATEVLFKRTTLFDDYIIVSPSLWWDAGSLATNADAWVTANATAPIRIFLAMGNNDDWMRPQADALVAALKAHTRAPFQWTYEPFPNETHATILHRAVYRAFEVLNAK